MAGRIKTAVLVSGGGTNLQALIDAQADGRIASAEIALVLSNQAGAYALERAARAGIPHETVLRRELGSREAFEARIVSLLEEHGIGLIVLAGFLAILSEDFTRRYDHRILNIHPSLIPSFCGEGYYGLRVHEEALKKGVKVTGATAHFVNEVCDGGPIIIQKAVEVKDGDTPEILQKRVMEQAEWKILPGAVALFCEDKIKVTGNKTVIQD